MELFSSGIRPANSDAGSYTSELSFDGEKAEFTITAKRELTLSACTLSFEHVFTKNTRIFVNGYQSWTASREYRIRERMRDLSHVPSSIVRHYALDAMGDYRFVEYNTQAGHFHGFTYATIRDTARSDELTLIGSIDESNGFTLIEIDVTANTITLSKECPARALEPGESLTLCRCAVITVDDRGKYTAELL